MLCRFSDPSIALVLQEARVMGVRERYYESVAACFCDKPMLGFAIGLSLLVYGLELTNFTLSIDEELHSYGAPSWRAWASQGRWGMALLCYVLPPFSTLPLLATLLFCLGLAASALLLAPIVARNRVETLVFVGTFVSCPIWMHIAEFNTLSWGFAVGLFSVAVASACLRIGGMWAAVAAGLCLAFAIGIYQSLVLLYAVIGIVLWVRGEAFWGADESMSTQQRQRVLRDTALSILVGVLTYYGVHRAVLVLSRIDLVYLDNYVRLIEFTDAETRHGAVTRTLKYIRGLLSGQDATFLGWGWGVLLLPWIGFFAGVVKLFRSRTETLTNRLGSIVALLVILSIVFAPVIVSAGSIPNRALVALPLFYSLLTVNAFRFWGAGYGLRWCAFAFALFVSWWISTALFHAEGIARQRDQVMATRVMQRIEEVGRNAFPSGIPLAVIGEWQHERDGDARRVEIFGTSFFEHDGGNVYRIVNYLRLLGLRNVQPLPVVAVRDRLAEVVEMPAWPEPGAVTRLGDMIVLKLGPPSYQQQLQLNR